MTQAWTLLNLLNWTIQYFTEKEVESPRASAEILLSDTLGISRLDLYVRFEQPVMPEELACFRERIKRRVAGAPVAYIVGHKGFWKMTLAMTPAVLIPRPETERLIEEILSLFPDRTQKLSILDLGTGSGAIALALAGEYEQASILAVDVSPEALAVAGQNLDRMGMADRVILRVSNWLEKVDSKERFDLIVSNPPYIPSTEIAHLQTEVREFEPKLALDGGLDGLRDIFYLLEKVPVYLVSGGYFLMETGSDQKKALEGFLKDRSEWKHIEFIKDYAGLDRIVVLQKV